ncbi:hypothetical protein GIS00_05815 [Nakamurella sp. YIM 132087]|uniref:DUF7878 domain-containing protein n=1 Tax=Nakamurella alba TaxID=2665158 RepID=A0A7K1FH60_9ACTN|nr:hypothetical protein [Nakamurella alba]MTD13461.1 hypothetical protein [Nakamurella alba]
MHLDFTGAGYDLPAVSDSNDVLIGVVATFRLYVAGRLIVSEPEFTIVELRTELLRWLADPSGDFEFLTVEHDEPGLVWIRRQPSGQWRVGSIWQSEIGSEELGFEAVSEACSAFAAAVESWVFGHLGIQL